MDVIPIVVSDFFPFRWDACLCLCSFLLFVCFLFSQALTINLHLFLFFFCAEKVPSYVSEWGMRISILPGPQDILLILS